MKIKREQLHGLAERLFHLCRSKDFIKISGTQVDIEAKIVKIVSQNFAEEDAIEEEARAVLASHAASAKDMDPFKMFLLAKQKLAAKKGFIL